MIGTNLISVPGLALFLTIACGSEPDAPRPVRGIEGSGVRDQGIQGSGFRTLGIQGTGRNANASKNSDGEAGSASAE